MNKVICDVCGTSYPETASQCPICGCAKPEDAQSIAADASGADVAAAGTYTYIKGGRFSKANVRKRNSAVVIPKEYDDEEPSPENQKDKSNTPLIITAILLVLAIIAILFYIYFEFFSPQKPDEEVTGIATTTTAAATTTAEPSQSQTTATTAPQQIKCTELKLSESAIQLDAVGNAWLINVTPVPADTTDVATFSTSDPKVATVTAEGRVTAVGPGNAVITIVCGDVSASCNVTCNIATEPTTQPTTEPTTKPVTDTIKLNREDFTLAAKGETWTLYKGNISLTQITWSSDNEAIATFDKGVVTAVGPGWTYVHAEYNGEKVSCIVRCTFADAEDPTTETTQPGQTPPATGEKLVHISHVDVSIDVGESFNLRLIDDATKEPIPVTWTASRQGVCEINGNKITGLKAGSNTRISCVYQGATYVCIVYVRN